MAEITKEAAMEEDQDKAKLSKHWQTEEEEKMKIAKKVFAAAMLVASSCKLKSISAHHIGQTSTMVRNSAAWKMPKTYLSVPWLSQQPLT